MEYAPIQRNLVSKKMSLVKRMNTVFSNLQGEAKFIWVTEQQESSQALQRDLTLDPVLGLFDQNAPMELHSHQQPWTWS